MNDFGLYLGTGFFLFMIIGGIWLIINIWNE